MKHSVIRIAAVSSLVLALTTACGSEELGAEREGDLALVDIAVLEAPSLTSFYAPIIDGLELDRANGLDITFVPKSTVALRTEVANGSAQVTAGASVLTDVALLNQQGADTEYLFNVFDWWGTVVTPSDSAVDSVSGLAGKTVVGALSTTNYAMFKITAGLDGVELSSLKENTAEPSGLVAAAKSGRQGAVQLWEPAHTVLTAGNDDFRSLDLVGGLKKALGIERIPYVGMAVQRAWLAENEDLVQPMYATFADAVDFIRDNPDEAAELIAEATGVDGDALRQLIGAPDRLALDVYPAKDAAAELEALLEAAVEYGVLTEKPEVGDLVYDGELAR
ncbi:ABC transporter substrate-binding protein [Nocardioides carbamazepini]|uniref:ABC transporter substrate-binding protein n=1 Tax=Nocardioides carbamazepini TaxID=2854259 RepID=UPI002149FDA4|nr:ABC transporter substrate-binding protein [Nocardioides carbamazepini]MCR1786087.1 ABC transporter substrate-binding protein [Nocardioides carbamazepini]